MAQNKTQKHQYIIIFVAGGIPVLSAYHTVAASQSRLTAKIKRHRAVSVAWRQAKYETAEKCWPALIKQSNRLAAISQSNSQCRRSNIS